MDKHNRDLLIRALKGTLDTASRREFDLWVSNADNLRIYENALRIWDDTQRRAAAYTPDRDRLWEQLQSRIGVSGSPQPTERPAPKRRWVPILRTADAVAAGAGQGAGAADDGDELAVPNGQVYIVKAHGAVGIYLSLIHISEPTRPY
mgnify:CR=1 FL=1